MPLFRRDFGDSLLKDSRNPSILETVVTVTGDTTPSSSTHDIIAAKFSVINSVGTDPGTDNLIAYWKLDETSGDSGDILIDSIGGHNAVITGTPDPIDAVVNNGFHFDETSGEWAEVQNSSELNFGDDQSFSITFWFRISVSNTAFLIHKSNSNTWDLNEYGFHQTGSDLLDFSIGDSTATSRIQSNNITDGEWHFAVGIVNRETDRFYLYVDDVRITNYTAGDSDISSRGTLDNRNSLYFGRNSDGTAYKYTGDLDEIRIYSKALTVSEAKFLYYNPPGKITGVQNPVGNANVNPLEVSGGGIVFNELASAPTVGGANKGVLYLRDNGLYFVDQDGNDVTAASYIGGSWFDVEGDSGIWHPGPIGIGDSTPEAELEVYGKIRSTHESIVSIDTGAGLEMFYNTADSYGRIFCYDRDATEWKDLIIGINATQLVLKSDGNVGIGVSDPAELLEVESSDATTAIQISNAAADGDPYLAFALSGTKVFTIGVDDGDADKLKIGTTAIGTDTRMTIDSSGNVGIGTQDPQRGLHLVTGTETSGLTSIFSGFQGIIITDDYGPTIFFESTTGDIDDKVFGIFCGGNYIGISPFSDTGNIDFSAIFALRRSGNVGIGTSSPGLPLDVKAKAGITAIGGIAIKLTNETGSATVAGQLVKADTATNDAVVLTVAEDDECIGVFLDSGVADGAEAWVVVSGIADVAMKDNTAATRGNWVETSDEAGYADATNADPVAAPTHFREIGHCIETVSAGGAGTHILARCVLHFN